MPPRRNSRSTNPPAASAALSATSKAAIKELERINHLFSLYRDPNSDTIDPEGIETLCSDLKIDHTDVRMLMLAWTMRAKRQGYFTREEWQRGLQALHADTLGKLQKALSQLDKWVWNSNILENFHSYAFSFCLTEEGQRSLDIETICELLNLVLGPRYPSQIDKLIEFLKIQHEYKGLSLDQWTGILRFCQEINFPGLDNYDESCAWPLILDNFVEWMKKTQK
ncbi:hypothetical protein QJS04_geneDACA013728 [Acorus gramineus]|uniref:Defective in cullin neddylation protein n=1 Tax=Acorus gramineus TaxID=55184 RepID=A0AAV9AZ10_ACOGR|nr:hypothetical protein QJS04_geneDACA013728 [Acorus gramineus]